MVHGGIIILYHAGAVSMGIDFSADSDWVRSGCAGGALLFWGTSKGESQDSPARFKVRTHLPDTSAGNSSSPNWLVCIDDCAAAHF
jgi:hypothetical protein